MTTQMTMRTLGLALLGLTVVGAASSGAHAAAGGTCAEVFAGKRSGGSGPGTPGGGGGSAGGYLPGGLRFVQLPTLQPKSHVFKTKLRMGFEAGLVVDQNSGVAASIQVRNTASVSGNPQYADVGTVIVLAKRGADSASTFNPPPRMALALTVDGGVHAIPYTPDVARNNAADRARALGQDSYSYSPTNPVYGHDHRSWLYGSGTTGIRTEIAVPGVSAIGATSVAGVFLVAHGNGELAMAKLGVSALVPMRPLSESKKLGGISFPAKGVPRDWVENLDQNPALNPIVGLELVGQSSVALVEVVGDGISKGTGKVMPLLEVRRLNGRLELYELTPEQWTQIATFGLANPSAR